MKFNPFTENEKKVMRDNYFTLGAIYTANLLPGRSRDVVKQWAHKNGLKVSKKYRSDVAIRTNLKFKRNMSDETRKRIGDGHRKHTQFICEICGKNIAQWSVRCSLCRDRSMEKNPKWRGGVAKLGKIINAALRQLWTIPIFIRDNYTCQQCGSMGSLEAHHLRKLTEIRDSVINQNPKLSVNSVAGKFGLAKLIIAAHTLEDGITLCKPCHRTLHRNKRGELQGTPTVLDEDNLQPIRSNVRNIIDWQVQRSTLEDSRSNKSDTSAPHTDILRCDEMI